MSDHRFTELLSKQLSGEISDQESKELDFLVADSKIYQSEYDALQGYLKEPMADDKSINVVFEKIKARIDHPEKEKPTARKLSIYKFSAVAAAVIVLVSVLLLSRQYIGRLIFKHPTDWMLAQTLPGERKTLTLADGTQVHINAGSHLKYPRKFQGDTRTVILSGEAFFDVKKDAKHPFVIQTDKIQVKVLGTAFDVKAYEDDDFTETTLIRGRVEIILNNRKSAPIILKPNDKFLLANDSEEANLGTLTYFTSNDPNAIIETSWIHDELMFKNKDFSSISKLFERWYGVKVVFKDPAVKSFKFTGQFKKENVSEALHALQLIENFNYNIQGSLVYIYK
ncbi:FecR family protein [Pedobacter sp. AW1-32]|uniref:FecR family protein n=1 Tax=Pedobacter sp. AW1-32 TaxID=3383026 RepID=UPI003FEFCD7A